MRVNDKMRAGVAAWVGPNMSQGGASAHPSLRTPTQYYAVRDAAASADSEAYEVSERASKASQASPPTPQPDPRPNPTANIFGDAEPK